MTITQTNRSKKTDVEQVPLLVIGPPFKFTSQPSNDGYSSGATATLAPQSSITTYLHHIHAILKLQRGIILLCGRSVAEACS